MTRDATQKDLPQLAALFDAYRMFYERESDLDGAMEFLRERLAQGDSRLMVYEAADGALTGFTQLYPLFSSTRMKRLWLLNDLYVMPAQRGKGISIALIDAAKNLAVQTGAAGLILETAKTNVIGDNLYPKAGFLPDTGHHWYSWDVPSPPGHRA